MLLVHFKLFHGSIILQSGEFLKEKALFSQCILAAHVPWEKVVSYNICGIARVDSNKSKHKINPIGKISVEFDPFF